MPSRDLRGAKLIIGLSNYLPLDCAYIIAPFDLFVNSVKNGYLQGFLYTFLFLLIPNSYLL